MSKILLFGDICPTDDYRSLFDSNKVFSDEIISEVKLADFVLGNLECPATVSNKPIIKTGPNLKAHPKDIEILSSIGFNAFSLANNHIRDYGNTGIEDTFSTLEKNGLKYFGAGFDINNAKRPLIININNKKIGFISFAEAEFNLVSDNRPGANHFDPYESFDDIRHIKSEVDYLIVLYHGGIEYYQYPSPFLQKKCRKMIDCGADLVSIQHSHCIGTFEKYNNGHILYGQGNSVFGFRPKSQSWNEGLLVIIDIETKSVNYQLMSATPTGIEFTNESLSNQVLNEFYKRSAKLRDQDWIKNSWIEFCLKSKSLTLPQLLGKSVWFNRFNRLTKNKLIDLLYTQSSKMTTLNLIRCEAHHEVMCTVLENEIYK